MAAPREEFPTSQEQFFREGTTQGTQQYTFQKLKIVHQPSNRDLKRVIHGVFHSVSQTQMHTYTNEYIYISTNTDTYLYTQCMYTYIQTFVHMHTQRIHIYIMHCCNTYISTFMHAHTYTHLHAYTYVYLGQHVSVYQHQQKYFITFPFSSENQTAYFQSSLTLTSACFVQYLSICITLFLSLCFSFSFV